MAAISCLIFQQCVYADIALAPISEVLPKKTYTKEELVTLSETYADRYKVSREVVRKVVQCESSYNIKAIGDGGTSYGLVQIHLPAWKNITKEDAFNPDFAFDFLAKKISEGQGYHWTCFRNL